MEKERLAPSALSIPNLTFRMVTILQEQTVRQFGIVSIVRKTQNIEYHVIFSIKYYEPQNIKPILANDHLTI